MFGKKLYATLILMTAISSVNVSARPQETYIDEWAVSYARQWVDNNSVLRNPSYRSFESDCTNFVSQSLRAGGWRNTTIGPSTSDLYWYYASSSSYSQTWSVANALYRRFAQNYEGWSGGRWYTGMNVNYGDIFFADWDGNGIIDHTMIVTGFKRNANGTLEPRVSYHSNEREDLPIGQVAISTAPPPYNVTAFYRYSKYPYPVNPPSSRIF